MARPRKNFVAGYADGLTGPSGFIIALPRQVEGDLLQKWTVEMAKTYPNKNAVELASRNWSHFLDVLLRRHGAVVVQYLNGELSVYSAGAGDGYPAKKLPRKLITLMSRYGVNSETPTVYFRNAYADALDRDQAVRAGKLIPGLPPPEPEQELEPGDPEAVPAKDYPKFQRPRNREQLAALRRHFWAGQTDPKHAEDIVDILMAGR